MSGADGGGALRLGYLGAVAAAEAVVRAAKAGGWDGAVEPVEAFPADPFGPLRDGTVDVLLTRFAVEEPDLVTSAPLCTEDRILVAGRGHPLAGLDSVSYEDVAAYEVFARPPSMPPATYEQIVPGRTPSGRPVRRVLVAETVQDMVAAVVAGTAVHPTISSLATWLRHPGLVFLPIRDLPAAPVALTWVRPADPAGAERVRAFAAAALAGWPADGGGDRAGGP